MTGKECGCCLPPINTVLIVSESCLKTPCYHASTPYYIFICLHIPLSAICEMTPSTNRLRGRRGRKAAAGKAKRQQR